MRIAILVAALCTTLAACGDDAPRNDGPDDTTTAEGNDQAPSKAKDHGISAEGIRKLGERLKKKMAEGNRKPGMPNDMLEGGMKTAREAARRLKNSAIGTFTTEQFEKFVGAAKELAGVADSKRAEILKKYGLNEMAYKMMESLFKRARGVGPALNSVQEKLVKPWLDKWVQATDAGDK